jgi:hypothetical protein
MTQVPAAVFKIPAQSPQPARGTVSRARKAAAAKPELAGRVVGTGTRAATRGEGEVKAAAEYQNADTTTAPPPAAGSG